MSNRIGVIIATFNGERYIKEQLESIINQSIKPDFILVTDGGSNDNTINICEEYLSKKTIRYEIITSKSKLGVKDNFEKGIKNCHTKYIFFSDQDDYWLPDKIKNAMKVFEDDKVAVVFCNAHIVNDKLDNTGKTLWNKIGYHQSNTKIIYEKNSLELQSILLKHNIMTGMCMAIDSKIVKNILPISNYSIHDSWIAHTANFFGDIASLDSKDVLYRQHSNNVIGAKKSIVKSFNKRDTYLKKLKNKKKFLDDILLRYDIEEKIKNYYINYLNFVDKRISFIEKRIHFYNLLLLVRDYIKYEYNCIDKILKDIIARITIQRG